MDGNKPSNATDVQVKSKFIHFDLSVYSLYSVDSNSMYEVLETYNNFKCHRCTGKVKVSYLSVYSLYS